MRQSVSRFAHATETTKKLRKSNGTTYRRWFKEVRRLYKCPELESCEAWEESYEDNMTPNQAVQEDMNYAGD